VPGPFRIVPKQSAFVLSPNRPTKVKYEAVGATNFELIIQQLGMIPSQKLASASGEFEIDLRESIPELVKRVGPSIANSSRYNAAKSPFDGYTMIVRDAYRNIVGKNPSGIPVLIKADVQAYNADGKVVCLPHSYFVEIPKKDFEQFQSAATPRVAAGSNRPTRSEAPSSRSKPRKPRMTTTANQQSAMDYSSAFRETLAEMEGEPNWEQLKADVAAADAKYRSSNPGSSDAAAYESRTWTDTRGRTVRAKYMQRKDEVVVISNAENQIFRIPLERLSEADREWVAAQSPAGTPAIPPAAVSLEALGSALQAHQDVHGSYPPKGLVSEDGTALLSWRVLLLEQLGYASLAAAFRYDEPWDSEHNRKLIPLMPAVFSGDAAIPGGKTPYVAVVSSSGAISDRYATRGSDIQDPPDKTLLLLEVTPGVAQVWTQPVDPTVNDCRNFDTFLRFRNDRVLACFVDASLGAIALGTPELEWKKLISIRDGQRIQADIERVNTAER
jgi:hypothetical protein